MKIYKRLILFLFSICFFSLAAYARDVIIIVEDDELELPLEGAVVSLRSGEQFSCDEDGIARIVLPDNRQTIVQITYPGYETQRMTIPAGTGSGEIPRLRVNLRLGGVMTGRELVVEAQRPDTSETRTGRSVAVSERELTRTAEIGIVEDVMSSVKLLPGVGNVGMFGAFPSIRGGDPGDLTAVFDGFYLERPFHWAGAFSIFDPKMVSSARLSHGVFSSRYGHTSSGLLEINSKSPSPTETEMEVGIGTSAASLNLSFPFNGRGGILLMGKVTYWDTLVLAAKGLSKVVDNENLDMINYVTKSPYIRSTALSANYRFTPETEWRLNGFFGSDGVAADIENLYTGEEDIDGSMNASSVYDNYQGFLITGFTTSPKPTIAVKFTGGVGFNRTVTDNEMNNDVTVKYNDDFLNKLGEPIKSNLGETYDAPDLNVGASLEHTIFNAQARADVDWELGKGFIVAFGVQEFYSLWKQKQDVDISMEMPLTGEDGLNDFGKILKGIMERSDPTYVSIFDQPNLSLILPSGYRSDILNHGLTSSIYGLVEYIHPGQRFGAELGLRIDHLYFKGKDFSANTKPAFNPRLNFDFNILKNKGILDTFDISIGTGLFSSVNTLTSFFDGSDGFGDELKFNRAWTSVIGFKTDLAQKYSFNIEGYYKYIFDRSYITATIKPPNLEPPLDPSIFTDLSRSIEPAIHFDGRGHVGGFDLQLQRMESRYWDGWI